ncbi:polysaccharide pyruvyl transferase family protein, partial [Candidatus Bathyarchaeota archaeon]|nr:polysaccharide pyruvyl transferase family protein [Candidatus Bathyarchaeota archaeon]
MEVLVYGGWFGSGNLGDEAILIGVRKILEEHLPETRLTALSINPQYTEATCGVEAVKLESPRTVIKNRKTYFDLFREADACIVTGGTPFYDYGHLSRIIHMGLPSINEKKLICFGVGSKPITSLKGREITRRLL